ncbi:MAG: ribosomal RNA small subunit methyltransferase A [Chloroflexi bacterium]|nr:ribosomal RNA small subunit methyltransferase A [Chloroflexota bacterium]
MGTREEKSGGGGLPLPLPARSPSQVKALLRRFGLRAKKSLGQNFLLDDSILAHVLTASDLTLQDLVLEIGPGLGILTTKLAERAKRVIAVELDPQLASFLKHVLAPYHNIELFQGDILRTSLLELIKENIYEGAPSEYKVVANLPYNITSPVLRYFLEAPLKPSLMVVMVQKEVAKRLTAQPGDMSLLSIAVQLYGKPRIIHFVPARCFYPAPKVDSAIVRIDIFPKPAVDIGDGVRFFQVVHAGFSHPRKQLHNSLAEGLGIPSSESAHILEEAGIAPKRRAETLALEEWSRLSRIMGNGRLGSP